MIDYLKKKHAKERHPETNTGSKQFKNLHGHHSKCNLLHRFLNSPQIIEVFHAFFESISIPGVQLSKFNNQYSAW